MIHRYLDPGDTLAEVLFGLIMVLTFTVGAQILIAEDQLDAQELVIAAVGCNLAWGVIDGVLYLMGCLAETGRSIVALRAARAAASAEAARPVIAGSLPVLVASVMSPAHLDEIWERLKKLPEPPPHARLAGQDWLGALGVFVLVTLSILPVALPFAFMSDAVVALRVSNGIALAMLFVLGWQLARLTGRSPWRMGLAMTVVGSALVALAIALGG